MRPTALATALLVLAPLVLAPPASAAIPLRALTQSASTAYTCTDETVTDPGYTVTVDQTVTVVDTVAAGGTVPVTVDALTLTLDDIGAAALRAGGVGAVSGSSAYALGYGAPTGGILTLPDATATVAEQPVGTEGPLTLTASATSGAAPVEGSAVDVYPAPSFDLVLTLVGGAGGTRALVCGTDSDAVLASVPVTGTAGAGPAVGSRATDGGSGGTVVLLGVVLVAGVVVGGVGLRRTLRRPTE